MEAVFFELVRELGLEELIPRLRSQGQLYQGVIALCTIYMCPQPTDDLLVLQFIRPLVGDDVVKVHCRDRRKPRQEGSRNLT